MNSVKFVRLEEFLDNKKHSLTLPMEPQGLLFAEVTFSNPTIVRRPKLQRQKRVFNIHGTTFKRAKQASINVATWGRLMARAASNKYDTTPSDQTPSNHDIGVVATPEPVLTSIIHTDKHKQDITDQLKSKLDLRETHEKPQDTNKSVYSTDANKSVPKLSREPTWNLPKSQNRKSSVEELDRAIEELENQSKNVIKELEENQINSSQRTSYKKA